MASSSSSSIRSWRTAFLTLRDETLSLPTRTSLHNLLHNLIFSHSHSLISAAPNLPPHEVTSDLLFLFELTANASADSADQDFTLVYIQICHLIYNLTQGIVIELNSSSWALLLDSFDKMMEYFLGKSARRRDFNGNIDAVLKTIIECLNILRRLCGSDQRRCSQAENIQLVKFLLRVVASSHGELLLVSSCSSGNTSRPLRTGVKLPRYHSMLEVQTIAFTVISEVYSRIGSSIPADVWKSAVEVLRKVMDALASKSMLVEDNFMSRFYVSVLNCLHLVLTDPKGSLSDDVAGFVATLRMFLIYGLTKNSNLDRPVARNNVRGHTSVSPKWKVAESANNGGGPYRPPHLRKKESTNLQQPKPSESQSFSDHEKSMTDLASSDSDYSDSDGSFKDYNSVHSSKARLAAVVCIQDICQADPKSFTAQWAMLLPSTDVLQRRKYEATLMSCLLFDPHLKTRIASASTLAAMLDGPTAVFLQVAEYKEPTKCGSFTPLSSSLGQILVQLHNGILHLIQRESHSGLLASSFKILLLLLSSTPYLRMPVELLPTVISALQVKVEDMSFLIDQTGLLPVAVSCLAAALSTSPSSPQVKNMLLEELSIDFLESRKKKGVLFTIFRCIEEVTSPAVSFEALQALRAVLHHYPSTVSVCWEQVSNIVYGSFSPASLEDSKRPWNGHHGNTVGLLGEKVITAAIRVLDEGLRAISGFRGTEDLLDDKFPDTPFTSDCVRIKKISSAPSYGPESSEGTKDELGSGWSGNKQWCEALERHMPLILHHNSAMVRAASVTCFAGITSSCFFSLIKEKQNFILSSVINAAKNEAPSVKTAACRAIGVITCFPQIFERADILDKFIQAAEINTRDSLVSVRITSSWALANICDSLRHYDNDAPTNRCYVDLNEHSESMALLLECALRLTKDGDKIKSNAVRALGNLSRFVKCSKVGSVNNNQVNIKASSLRMDNIEKLPSCNGPESSQRFISKSLQLAYFQESQWLGRMVQAFLSCVTTGNVKVQWNVCHALSNLFLNETLRLQNVDWAPSVFSILLLLLRDSSNFKIRIQAAAALSVPSSVSDYGSSFSDVIQGLVHIVEISDNISAPSSFKYRVALENQLTSTMLHVLSLASSTDHVPLKDFIVKKALFLEEWFKWLCTPLADASIQTESDITSVDKRKKEMISKAIQSLIKLYNSRNHFTVAQKFEKLADIIR